MINSANGCLDSRALSLKHIYQSTHFNETSDKDGGLLSPRISLVYFYFLLLLLRADDDAAREAHLTFPGFLGDWSILTSQLAAGACKIVTAVEAAGPQNRLGGNGRRTS